MSSVHAVRAVRHPLATQLTQLWGILFLRTWVRLCFRTRVRRAGPRLPAPCVFACNHRSFADPPLVAMWSAEPVAFFARSNLWRIPVIRQLLDLFYGIPVERDNPGLSSMKGAVERLRAGISVLVFPEGTRTRTGRLGRLRYGPALFARRSRVPLVPVYVHRSECIWPRWSPVPLPWGDRVEVRFGRPIAAPPGLDPRTADAWVTDRLQEWMERQEQQLNGRPPVPAGAPSSR